MAYGQQCSGACPLCPCLLFPLLGLSLWRSRKGHGEENQVLVAEDSGLNLTSCHSFPLANVFQVPAAGQTVPGMVATAILEFR